MKQFDYLSLQPAIITAAITGNRTDKALCKPLPITPTEQAIECEKCVEAGASIVHLHVREDDGSTSHRRERFEEAMMEIRSRCGRDVIIEVSTRVESDEGLDTAINCLSVDADTATLNVGSINIGMEIFINKPNLVRKLAMRIYKSGMLPVVDVFDAGHLETCLELINAQVLSPTVQRPLKILFVMGIQGGLSADPRQLYTLIQRIEGQKNIQWHAVGIGKNQLRVGVHTLLAGGHPRVGLEDTTYYKKGIKATGNAQLVKRVADMSKQFDRPVATPALARKMLGLVREPEYNTAQPFAVVN